MAGFGLGGCIPVDYALVGEFTPRKQRGKVLTAMDGWWPIGAALCGFVSAGLVALFGDWRLTMLVMVLPALLVFWVRRSVPESPLFLIRKGRRDEAAKVIDDLVAATGAEPRVYSLPEAQDAPGSPPAAPGPSCACSGSTTGKSRRRPGPCSSASCWSTTCR